ncbi:hypothetical protein OA88_02675 [Flavobacterium sp. JRM]|nr:hypothetical protein OA88_02675 [Flavobacterium sp. JRM]
MRLFIILFFATLLSCVDKKEEQKLVKNKTEIGANTQTDIDCGDFILKVDIDKDDFSIVNKGDTIFIYKELYGSIEDKKISIIEKGSKLSNIELNENIETRFYQRMTDDNSGSVLDFYYKKINKPNLVSNGFISSNSESFKSILLDKCFLEVKKESLKKQKQFYNSLLANKKKHENCCPEYIRQAKDFLNKKDEVFTNFESLNVSPFINKNIITIKYDIKKTSKRKIIVFNDESEEKINSSLVSSKSTITTDGIKEINSWEFSPSQTEKFLISLYAPAVSSQNQEEYFNYGFLTLKNGQKTFESNNIIRLANENSPYSAFEKIVFKNNFFTIEQHGDINDYSIYEYITFKYENKLFYLHKYSIEFTSKIDPNENIPSKNWTKKDFGAIKLEDLTVTFLENLRNKEPIK